VAGSVWDNRYKFIRWGEGGWINPGGGAVPRTPDPTLRRLSSPLIQDLDAAVDVTRSGPSQRYGSTERAIFQKAIDYDADVTMEGTVPSVAKIRCLLDFGEFNNDGFGNDPAIWEIGVFADHPTISGQLLMVAYGTFGVEVKTSLKQIERFVRIGY
jgi:hypothetical protein